MANYITAIRTTEGDKKIDYNALANLPTKYDDHLANNNIHITASEKNAWNAKLDAADALTSSTASMFGLGSNATPDNIFAFLGKYNQHWWRTSNDIYEIREVNSKLVHFVDNHMNNTVTYASSIQFNESTGVITLVSPQTIIVGEDQTEDGTDEELTALGQVFSGKYVTNTVSNKSGGIDTNIYFIPNTVEISGTSMYGDIKTYDAVLLEVIENWETATINYVTSSNQNAYPNNGFVGGTKYMYVGVPFNNFVDMHKTAIGSYCGTGTSGIDNPNSLTFNFVPKLVIIVPDAKYHFGNSSLMFMHGQMVSVGSDSSESSTSSNSCINIRWYGNSVSWYCVSESYSSKQLNDVGTVYYYVAIG